MAEQGPRMTPASTTVGAATRPADFYEGVADLYDAPSHEAFYRGLAHELVALLPSDAAVRTILEVGAGTGFGTHVLRERFPSAAITAVEPSAAMIAHAVDRVPDVEYLQQSLADVSADGSFDLVACFVAEHWLEAGEPERLVELSRGGLLALSAPIAPPRPLATGNQLLRDAVFKTRAAGRWTHDRRREPVPRGALSTRSGSVQRDAVVGECYPDAPALARALYERGSLMAVAGDGAREVERVLASRTDATDVDFTWAFRLFVADDRP
ncbi:MAG: class I SAM-dependent methyltransferase [Coriobacteriales bacterium]|nr:class I SAM-dependent methyltransferase [Coriobacteriales bacterium]